MKLSRAFHSALAICLLASCAHAADLEWIQVDAARSGFELSDSQKPFRVWGVNYDHDPDGRLLEDYWHDHWPTIAADFAEIKALGANTVRVHLQLARFMQAAEQPNAAALEKLQQLLALAENSGLYLDLTGLGCYHKADVPAWYDELTERERWDVQARFWEAVARACASSPAVFCYDLMNEPVVPGNERRDDWLGPAFAGKHFVQFVTRDLAGRQRPDVAMAWIAHLTAAIRRHDRRHLITVGLVDWSLEAPGLTSGFVPDNIVDELDFIAVHVYPQTGKIGAAIETLRAFSVGKPVIVEETFPLKCSTEELVEFIDQSPQAAGWISFYWGQTSQECRAKGTLGGAITAQWLDRFSGLAKP